jgi:hypothetical protein
MANEALKIFDESFVVTSQIERAPHWTMIRELTMNAIEAAARAPGDKLVHWTSGTYQGVRKAVLWNAGPGMGPSELKAATDLACRIDKNLGLDENFGVGAKVSSLANNKHGIRMRSCKDGRVSEVILGYDARAGQYVRFERELSDGVVDTVIDVTASAIAEGKSVDSEWTEVMLLGNSAGQDTVAKPFSAISTEKAHVATALYRRFYRLPEGVTLRLDAEYHRFDSTRRFLPIGNRYDKFARTESVPIPELGVTVHYLHDPNIGDKSGLRKSASGALGSTTTTCCLIHKDEMYSVMTGNEWSAAAPRFGIPFGSKELSVHIELHDDDARPSQYRERLISKHTGEDVLPEDYAFCVRERMPEWVKDVIRDASPRRTEDYNDLRRELQDLLNKYRVRIPGRRLTLVDGQPSAEQQGQNLGRNGSTGRVRNPGAGRRFHEAPEGSTTTSLYEVYEKAPNIIMLVTPDDVVEKGLKGRGASFVSETGDLFVNGLYEAIERTVADIEPEFAGQAESETVRELVTKAARWAMAFRVGKATVFALAKRANADWDEADMAAALSKESLSIAADDYLEGLSFVRKRVREDIKREKVAA